MFDSFRHGKSVVFNIESSPYPLGEPLTAAVIEFRGAAVGVAGDPLSGFQGAVIFQKIRDAGRPEGVRRIMLRQPGLFEPSFKHVRGIGAYERPAREFASFSESGREKER